MKKFLLAIIVIAAAVFTGCSKEEKGDGISGTTWSYVYIRNNSSNPYTTTLTYTFESGGVRVTSITESKYGKDTESWAGTYIYSDIYSDNTVYMALREYGDVWEETGEIYSNKMDVYDEDGYLYTLTKQ